METRQTSEYPTRYVAFEHPGEWIEHMTPEHRGGYEFAVYHEPMPNTAYPDLTDGIYIEIVSYQGQGWLLSCHATRPDQHREQHNLVKRYASYPIAKQHALNWLANNARKFLSQV